ncbi:hypothetical protein A7985_07325 [Pseudoalteromonas luteoviolacea]|uniref:Uncharacterized protein n=1 Tax=Pseudoalteromonas luteoviolacea TaxID=43657 RepID=A0A1C0TWN6_9GAMM|nr:hypothetical protein [Pseudoalteromonas luteoviolacea]OCQ23742.1 hypothetical protein A7985_07325 [Pseudoalteromonas luteoviolacea]
MEDNKFFKLVWRFNGLLISVTGILAIGVLLFAMYQIFKDITRERNTQNIVNFEESGKAKESWRLGHVTSLTSHRTLMIPLNSDQSFNRGYFSKSSNSTRNYLFINTETNLNKWLFNHTNFLIESASQLRIGDYSSKEPVIAILYSLVKLDSNSDNRLTPSDLTTVSISKPNGSGYKEILTDVEHVIGNTLLSETELFIIYQLNGKSLSSIINLTNFEIVNTKELPKVGL